MAPNINLILLVCANYGNNVNVNQTQIKFEWVFLKCRLNPFSTTTIGVSSSQVISYSIVPPNVKYSIAPPKAP